MYEAGFYPVPAYISCHSSFTSSTLTAVHNACLEWNSAGAGNIVYRTTALHNTEQWPLRNGANEITKNVVSNDDVLMRIKNWVDYVETTSEADIDINVFYPMGSSSDTYDVQTLITHEIGHLLGLADVSTSRSVVMYRQRNIGEQVRTLSSDDKNGILFIYD